ncbi:hypothetical protein HYH02_002301 [Chlamydomonas schloesseri]|uniref:J domain-containing protein n=1 Tax=Chlamydomonas schloesseri TaxID=2026947 RepID=A0A836BBJ8_9CHLO|nr:hypothetical protein HYH02_002301 [Chlamydomonas schloesseri]|eukprot:KAG2452964.1 hypothetical protein HYH02_002301 [Chlamydomonas schloesseri]
MAASGRLPALALLVLLLGHHAVAVLAVVKDPYKVLGVAKDADADAIKRAYKKLALKYHPDKNPKGQGKFIEIQHAYEILSDADKKRDYDEGGGSGGGHYRHHQHHQQYQQYQRYQEQQQRQYEYYQQQQQQRERHFHNLLPSNTSFVTSSNVRNLVFHSSRPWILMLYSETVPACKEFSVIWEALWRSLGGVTANGGNRDGAVVGLGRVHVRDQRTLVAWIMRGGSSFSSPGSLSDGDLPLLVAVPRGCDEAACFLRYRGPLRLSALQDFAADKLLRLPRVAQLEPQTAPAFLARASPYKVVVVAFGRAGGSGSFALRSLALRQKDMLTVTRAHVQEGNPQQAAAWQQALGLSSPPAAGSLVFLRGPGTAPRVVPVPSGKSRAEDMQQLIDETGVLWQEVPPLRPSTGASLGCLWGRSAAASGRSMIDTCVLAVGPGGGPGSALEEGRRRMALLGRLLASAASQRDPTVSAAATAYMAGKLRLTWFDSTRQHELCSWFLAAGGGTALRPTSAPVPPGSNAAGRAAAINAANTAAAAKAPELLRTMCGPGRWDVLGRAKQAAQTAAAAAATVAGRPDLAAKLGPARGSVHLVILRPSIDQSSWFRGGGAHHTRNGRRVFLHAVNADFDLAAPQAPHGGGRGSGSKSGSAYGDADLGKLAMWINAMHGDPDRQMHASATFPPPLQADDEPGALEYVAGRLYEAGRTVLDFVMQAGGLSDDGSAPLSSEMQYANLAIAVVALLFAHYAIFGGGGGGAGRPAANIRRPSPGLRRAAAAVAAAGGTTVSQPPSEQPQPPEARRGDGEGDGRDGGRPGSWEERQAERHAGGIGRDQGAEARERGRPAEPVVVNRRALSPSWRTGRRGDDDGEDGAAAASSGKEEREGARTPRRRSANGAGAGIGETGEGAGGGGTGTRVEADAGGRGGANGDSEDVEVVDVVGGSDTEGVRVADTSGANTGELGPEDSWEHVEER